MKEGHLTVARTARFYTLGELGATTREVWFACHGYAQLARFFARSFTDIADESRVVIAPEALNRYYYETAPGVHAADARVSATWMTKEDREHDIGDYVAYLDALYAHVLEEHRDVKTVALGFSQGTATVSRWAQLGVSRLDHVVLWGGSIPADIPTSKNALRGADIIIAVGDADPFMTAARIAREEARLQEGQVGYRLLTYAGGHTIERAGLEKVIGLIE